MFALAIREFGKGNFVVAHAERLASAVAQVDARAFAAILLDLNLPDSRGLATFTALQARAPATPVLILSGLGDEALAVASVRAGAQRRTIS